ncbi:alkylmercury lyase [Streptomyces sp. MBT49]|uniref:alkylmercury lyase family protein n=1 Tax=unclassified Streptomyces TaxID=2593676 RepID=UPI001909A8F0|nr:MULTISPECIES: alkylmercury lyase family protein [unclassified Streptomyces]MBK3623271.1 alkylmercury lyase [Streptomyces sp. MBT49]MBK3642343.1 alkylmercury lyase [Streptomyces sp. MBT33]
MRITLLTVPDCPNAPLARERIDQALDGRAAEVDVVEVSDETQAAGLGMAGSPTVLIDGADPFAIPGTAASVSCRLYRGPDGRTEGAPSVAALRRALYAAEWGEECDCPPMDAAGRDGRGRLAPVTGGLRAVQQAILRSFATTGHGPEPADLEQVACTFGRDSRAVLTELAGEDFLTLDDQGRIRAAYPFSATPTSHRVHLADGTEAWAMCAIDALGIPYMLGTDAVITSADPVTGEILTVTSTSGHMAWQPSAAVVYVGQRSCSGPAADVACGALNFFASRRSARSWARNHPDYTGKAIDQAAAEALGRSVFGSLLADHHGRELG